MNSMKCNQRASRKAKLRTTIEHFIRKRPTPPAVATKRKGTEKLRRKDIIAASLDLGSAHHSRSWRLCSNLFSDYPPWVDVHSIERVVWRFIDQLVATWNEATELLFIDPKVSTLVRCRPTSRVNVALLQFLLVSRRHRLHWLLRADCHRHP